MDSGYHHPPSPGTGDSSSSSSLAVPSVSTLTIRGGTGGGGEDSFLNPNLRTIPEDRSDAGDSSVMDVDAVTGVPFATFHNTHSSQLILLQQQQQQLQQRLYPYVGANAGVSISATATAEGNIEVDTTSSVGANSSTNAVSVTGAMVGDDDPKDGGAETEDDEEDDDVEPGTDGIHRRNSSAKRTTKKQQKKTGRRRRPAGTTQLPQQPQGPEQHPSRSRAHASTRRMIAGSLDSFLLQPKRWSHQTKLLVGLTIISMLVIILTVVLVIQFAPKRVLDTDPLSTAAPASSSTLSPVSESTAIMNDTSSTTNAPAGDTPLRTGTTTVAPSLERSIIQNIDSVLYRISNSDDLLNPNTPEYHARQWMLYEDLLQFDIIMAGEDRIAQRYIAAELFFALWNEDTDTTTTTTTLPTPNNDNNATPTPAYRNRRRRNQKQRQTTRTRRRRQLQQTPSVVHVDESECDWYGIICVAETSTIVKIILDNDNTEDARFNGTFTLMGTLPYELVNLTALRRLSLPNHALTGSIPVQYFDIHAAIVSDDGGDAASSTSSTDGFTTPAFSELHTLDLAGNAFTGTLPSALWTWTNLRYLYLNDNFFSGPLLSPITEQTLLTDKKSQWSAYSVLEDVFLNNNTLTGPLLPEFFQFPLLKQFSCSMNNLTGTLPFASFYNPFSYPLQPSLSYLDLMYNNFTGSISPLWNGNETTTTTTAAIDPILSNLTYLYMNRNQFSGPLPLTTSQTAVAASNSGILLQTPLLKQLWLQDNELTGSFPNEFATAWNNLQDLRLQNNALQQDTIMINQSHCDAWPYLQVLQVACNDTTSSSMVSCACCTPCNQ